MAPKKKNQGPPCVLPYWKSESTDKQTFLRAACARLMFLQSLLDAQILYDNVKTRSKHFDVHNLDAINKMVAIELPRTPDGFDASAALGTENLFNLSVPSDYVSHNSPVFKCSTRLHPKELKQGDKLESNKPEVKEGPCSLESLLMTPEQREQYNFPSEGIKLDKIPGDGSAFAIDCEMCKCGPDLVLTRFAIINFHTGEVVTDQLVKPDQEITDYVTPYSGITKEMLDPVTFNLQDAQNFLRDTVGSNDILIGHSLENDLKVLGVSHSRIIDTALLYPHIRGFPFRNSLKYISRKYLHSIIQNNDADGHNPVVDAETCSQLVKLILEHGLAYGDALSETIALSSYLKHKKGNSSTFIGSKSPEWDVYGCADHVCKQSLNECVDSVLSCRSQLVAATFDDNLVGLNAESLTAALQKIIEAQPEKTAIAIFVGPPSSLFEEFRALNRKRAQFRANYREQKWDEIENPWTQQDDERVSAVKDSLTRYKGLFEVKINKEEVQTLPKRIRERFLETHPHYDETNNEAHNETNKEDSKEDSKEDFKEDSKEDSKGSAQKNSEEAEKEDTKQAKEEYTGEDTKVNTEEPSLASDEEAPCKKKQKTE